MGLAWGVGGREARFLLGLGASGKVPRFQLPSCALRWWVRVEGDPRLIRGEWRRVECGSVGGGGRNGPWTGSTDTLSWFVSVPGLCCYLWSLLSRVVCLRLFLPPPPPF